MKFHAKNPPRKFEVGYDVKGTISDCGTMHLAADEQITFVTEAGAEYDVTRKDWGFYMGPSLNGRLASFNLRPVLVKNRYDRYFILLVERGHEAAFDAYVAREPLKIITWLDTTEALSALESRASAQ